MVPCADDPDRRLRRLPPLHRSGSEVPVRNMRNHVLHCYRNVFKCPMCAVAVLVKKRQQHVEQEQGTVCVAATPLSLRVRSSRAGGRDVTSTCVLDHDTGRHWRQRVSRTSSVSYPTYARALACVASLAGVRIAAVRPPWVLTVVPVSFVRQMLAHGADANCEVNEAGDTPLHVGE